MAVLLTITLQNDDRLHGSFAVVQHNKHAVASSCCSAPWSAHSMRTCAALASAIQQETYVAVAVMGMVLTAHFACSTTMDNCNTMYTMEVDNLLGRGKGGQELTWDLQCSAGHLPPPTESLWKANPIQSCRQEQWTDSLHTSLDMYCLSYKSQKNGRKTNTRTQPVV